MKSSVSVLYNTTAGGSGHEVFKMRVGVSFGTAGTSNYGCGRRRRGFDDVAVDTYVFWTKYDGQID